MPEEISDLEKLSLIIGGVVCGSDNPRYKGRAYIKTNRSVEDFLWSLAMDAGYTFKDLVEYEITIRRKAE